MFDFFDTEKKRELNSSFLVFIIGSIILIVLGMFFAPTTRYRYKESIPKTVSQEEAENSFLLEYNEKLMQKEEWIRNQKDYVLSSSDEPISPDALVLDETKTEGYLRTDAVFSEDTVDAAYVRVYVTNDEKKNWKYRSHIDSIGRLAFELHNVNVLVVKSPSDYNYIQVYKVFDEMQENIFDTDVEFNLLRRANSIGEQTIMGLIKFWYLSDGKYTYGYKVYTIEDADDFYVASKYLPEEPESDTVEETTVEETTTMWTPEETYSNLEEELGISFTPKKTSGPQAIVEEEFVETLEPKKQEKKKKPEE